MYWCYSEAYIVLLLPTLIRLVFHPLVKSNQITNHCAPVAAVTQLYAFTLRLSWAQYFLRSVTLAEIQAHFVHVHFLQVRGAPAIGVVGSLSLAAELFEKDFASNEALLAFVSEKLDFLVTAR